MAHKYLESILFRTLKLNSGATEHTDGIQVRYPLDVTRHPVSHYGHFLACVAFLLLSACEDTEARLFAVTFVDSTTVDCTGVILDEFLADDTTLEHTAEEFVEAYEVLRLRYPPVKLGRELRVSEVEGRMSAWFEQSATETHYDPITNFPALTYTYDGSHVVYEGERRAGTIEGQYDAIVNTDAEDDAADRVLCGDRVLRSGSLSLTDSESVQGRVRWTEITWQDHPATACPAYVRCSRDWLIEGVAVTP